MRRLALFALVLGACTPQQADTVVDKLVTGVSQIDPPIRKSYARELGVSGCLEPGKTDAEITACVRDSMECPASFAPGECMAKTIKEWTPVKVTLTSLHDLWCALDAAANGCKPAEGK